MKSAFFLIVVCFTLHASSQKLLRGIVLDTEKNNPIPYASIFLNNTSIGTKANDYGVFQLNIPQGRYELVVSSIGYETHSQSIQSTDGSDSLIIRLKPKAAELDAVVIEPYEKDGWQKWGRFFIEHFIGTSQEAMSCKIKNTDVIRFRHDKKKGELRAYASEALVIENKALGYRIHYELERFSMNFSSRYLLYIGYPFFEPMQGSEKQQRKWEKARRQAYEGSMMHFMRSLYRNTIAIEGFEIRALKKITNAEKQRVKQLYTQRRILSSSGEVMLQEVNRDSSEYYQKILRGPDNYDIIGSNILTGDSIAYAVTPTVAGVEFNDYLMVVYKKGSAPQEYQRMYPDNGSSMMSQITLLNGKPVEVHANGSYYDPVDLMSTGYWAWSEKIALLLPYDYMTPKK